MCNELRIGFGFKVVTGGYKLVGQLAPILYNTVVYDGNRSAAVLMGMSVAFTRPAMSCPACVPDTSVVISSRCVCRMHC